MGGKWWTILGVVLIVMSSVEQMPRDAVKLPAPNTAGGVSLNEVLAARRSVREFTSAALTWGQIGQLLWAAQGVTHGGSKRTAPSAGATYPLELYVATADGVFHYLPSRHEVIRVGGRDVRRGVRRAAGGQDAVDAPVLVVFAAVPERTAARYGDRAMRYVHIEVGHAAQNLLLEAAAIGLGAVPVGAFSDAELQRVLGFPSNQIVVYIVPVGHTRPLD
jgi:SagB-type dehydrogenase family enzyme